MFGGTDRKNDTVASNLTLDQLVELMRGGSQSKAGVQVDWKAALQVTTVLACVRKIADGLLVPRKVYQKVNGQRREAIEHPLYDILSSQPNEWQSAYEYIETLAFHAALTGNAFSFINRAGGKLSELIPIEPGAVSIKRAADRTVTYEVSANGSSKIFTANEIWHVRGPSWDSVCGLDAVKLTREAIGLALATEESHASMHKNGVYPSGILSVEGALDEANLVRLAAWVKINFTGLENASKAMVMDRSTKWQPLRMSGVDSEHIKTRELQVQEICQGFGVLPVVIGVSTNNTSYASVEQMYIAHLVHTVRPWHDRVTSSMDRWLLTKEERKAGYYTGFVSAALLQPSRKDYGEYLKVALGGGGNPGWVTPNEVRSWDDMPAIPGGDNLFCPAASGPIGKDGIPQTPQPAPVAGPATPAPKKTVPKKAGDILAVGRVLSAENEQLLREASASIGDADTRITSVLSKLDNEPADPLTTDEWTIV